VGWRQQHHAGRFGEQREGSAASHNEVTGLSCGGGEVAACVGCEGAGVARQASTEATCAVEVATICSSVWAVAACELEAAASLCWTEATCPGEVEEAASLLQRRRRRHARWSWRWRAPVTLSTSLFPDTILGPLGVIVAA
jgi:hypothetical protein